MNFEYKESVFNKMQDLKYNRTIFCVQIILFWLSIIRTAREKSSMFAHHKSIIKRKLYHNDHRKLVIFGVEESAFKTRQYLAAIEPQ